MSGYPMELFIASPPTDLYGCDICSNIFKSPKQCPRGHVFCDECIHTQIKIRPECPTCACPLDESLVCDCLLAKNIVGSMPIRCSTTLETTAATEEEYVDATSSICEGAFCTWTGPLHELDDHVDQDCGHAEKPCPNEGCGSLIQRRRLPKHDIFCGHKLLECNHCQASVKRTDRKQHDDVCVMKPVNCPQGCGASMPRQHVEEHLTIVCPLQEVTCPNAASIGCKQECPGRLLRRDLEAHMAHPSTLAATVQHLIKQVNEDQKVIKAQEATIAVIQVDREADKQIMGALKAQLERSDRVNATQTDKMNKLQDGITGIAQKATANEQIVADVVKQARECGATIAVEEAKVKRLQNVVTESQRMIRKLIQDTSTAKLIEEWKSSGCYFSQSAIKEQLSLKKAVKGEVWTTHHIAHEFPSCCFADLDEPFKFDSPTIDVAGQPAYLVIKKDSEFSVDLKLHHPHFQGTTEVTLTAFRFGRGPPRQVSDTHVWERNTGWGWLRFFNDAHIKSQGWLDSNHSLPVLATIHVKH